MIRTYLLATDFLENDEIYQLYYNNVSEFRRGKIDRYKFKKSKIESLGASILIDEVLKNYGLCEKDMQYEKNEYGKPFLKGYEDIHFSVSHTKGYSLCSFSDISVGADIQIIGRDSIHLVKRFYTNDEANYVFSKPDDESQQKAFYRLWSLKESYIKAVGKGMSIPIESFSVLQNGGQTINGCDGKIYYYKEYILDGYSVAVCSAKNDFSDNYEIINKTPV